MSGARSAWSLSCGANHEATPLWVSHIRAATTATTPAAANPRPCMG